MSSGPFLEPADVTPANARLVLDLLNAATSAQQIADAIEIPGELDIGVRLAQRILNRRAQLGSFTNLQQVADIPLIGPERFTEIVTALSPQRVPGRPATPLEQLQQEVAALRSLVEAGLAGPTTRRRLTLQPVEPHVFLGQPMTVVATLLDGDQPAVDVPVTFVATRGELRANDGYAAHSGHLVTARTGLDGTVRLTLQAVPKEELTSLQRDALGAMLALLKPTASTPQDTAEGFRTLAQQYAWEVNLPFRQAVDIFVRDFQPMLLDTVNLRDALAEWSFHLAAVLAFVAADANSTNGSGVTATATLHTRAQDWIPPFLQTFVELTRSQDPLTGELRDLSRVEKDTGKLVTAVYDRAGKYVAAQHGRVGAYVGRKVAETSIRNFLDTELQNMPLDARIDVFPALDVASKTLATTDVSVIRGLVGTRNDIAKEVDKKTRPTFDVGGLFDRVNGLEANLALVPSRDDHNALRNELLAAVSNTRSELTTLIDRDRSQLGLTRADLDAALAGRVTQADLNTALAGKLDRNSFTTFSRDLDRRFDVVDTKINDIRR